MTYAGSMREARQKPFCYLTKRKYTVMCDNALKTEKVRQNALELAIT